MKHILWSKAAETLATIRQRWRLSTAVVGIAGCVTLVALTWPAATPSFAKVRSQYTPSEAYLLDRHGEVIDSQRIDFDVRRFSWIALDDVSPALVKAIVDAEDRRFWKHSGVDWLSALGAVRDHLFSSRQRGASTITMQLSSLIESRGRREPKSWQRKFRQIRRARGLEAHWSKTQILEAYLNLLHFRGELQGVGAAAHALAGKSPAGLSLSESFVLAALLPSPNAKPQRVAERACARAVILRATVSCSELKSTAESLLAGAADSGNQHSLAPQLASTLLREPGKNVVSTLDASMQRLAYATLSHHLANLSTSNVRDGAAIVVDNDSGDVLAYVGSAGPASRAPNVDGVRAPRQAGSTLKPFLYGLALERRYLNAASLLDDSPLNIDTVSGVYIPQNYDHDFKGLVSVRTALASSLNIPAVRALVLVGVEPFRDRLYDIGYSNITQDGQFYGYSLALGSAEVSLWEQAQAYRALGRGGKWSPLRVRADTPREADRTLLAENAAFIISDILSDRAARTLTFGLDNHLNTGFWSAAKTGTSKDMRDNWCIGFSQRYTVAVWVGNFEGDAMHDVSGVTGAAPVWHELMSALHQQSPPAAPQPPAGVTTASTKFSPAVEPPRQEWFIDGSPRARTVVAVAGASALPRIVSPANGMIIAIDPDIPAAHQRVPLSAQGANSTMVMTLDDSVVLPANELALWTLIEGSHRLALKDANGVVLDRILFTVR